MDANCSAGLVDLSVEPFGLFARLGSVSRRHSHLPLFVDWRRDGRQSGATEDPARIPVRTDGVRNRTNSAGGDRSDSCVAYAMSLIRFRFGPGLWRPRVPGADS